jgi:hypothetical protein
MPSIDIRELRNARHLKVLLGEGKTVDLFEGRRLIARIEPTRQPLPKQWPNFARRRQKIFGERMLPGAKLVILERGRD